MSTGESYRPQETEKAEKERRKRASLIDENDAEPKNLKALHDNYSRRCSAG